MKIFAAIILSTGLLYTSPFSNERSIRDCDYETEACWDIVII